MSLKSFALALSADPDPQLFLGDEMARNNYLSKMGRALELYQEKASGTPFAVDQKLFMDDDDDEFDEVELPRGVQITPNGTALLKISGELAPSVGFFGRLMGMMGYNDIINALSDLTENPQVKRTLLLLNTPGGSANGIEAVAEVIQRADRVKPVYSFTDSQALSAGYWLGMQGRRFYASKTSRVGSIGVVTVHRDISKALAEAGISMEVLRAGKYKALGGNPFEPLSEEARGIIMNDLQTMYGFFLDAVSEARGMTRQVLIEQAAEGRVFFGEEGKKVNLVDDVLSLSAVLSRIERGSSSNPSTKNQPAPAGDVRSNRGFSAMKRVRVFSRQAQQMLAEGAGTEAIIKALGDKAYELISVEDAKAQGVSYTDEHLVEVDADGNVSAGEGASGQAPAPSASGAPAGDPAANTGEGEGGQEGGQEGEDPNAAAAAQAAASQAASAGEGFGAMQAKLMEVMDLNATLKAENTRLKGQAQGFESVAGSMQKIVVGRIQTMQIGLNMTPISDDVSLSAEALVALHDDVYAKFTKTFNVGQASKDPAGQQSSNKQPYTGPAQAAARVSLLGRSNNR